MPRRRHEVTRLSSNFRPNTQSFSRKPHSTEHQCARKRQVSPCLSVSPSPSRSKRTLTDVASCQSCPPPILNALRAGQQPSSTRAPLISLSSRTMEPNWDSYSAAGLTDFLALFGTLSRCHVHSRVADGLQPCYFFHEQRPMMNEKAPCGVNARSLHLEQHHRRTNREVSRLTALNEREYHLREELLAMVMIQWPDTSPSASGFLVLRMTDRRAAKALRGMFTCGIS